MPWRWHIHVETRHSSVCIVHLARCNNKQCWFQKQWVNKLWNLNVNKKQVLHVSPILSSVHQHYKQQTCPLPGTSASLTTNTSKTPGSFLHSDTPTHSPIHSMCRLYMTSTCFVTNITWHDMTWHNMTWHDITWHWELPLLVRLKHTLSKHENICDLGERRKWKPDS